MDEGASPFEGWTPLGCWVYIQHFKLLLKNVLETQCYY
jgi:hypothetical protein